MTATRSYNVLIVEDEGLIARDIANRLEAMGHRVTGIVATAKEAVSEAPGADIVLMDIRLDGPGDGIQAANIIRQHCAKPIVFLTAHADRSTLERAKQAVPYGYIVKPVQPATLGATLDVAVYKHQIERELAEQRSLLDSVLASVTEAIVVAGPSGTVRSLNAAAETLTGWSMAEAMGKPILEVLPLLPGGGDGSAEDPVPLTLLRGDPVHIAVGTELVRRDGTRVVVEGSAAPVHANTTLAGVAISLRDIGAREWHANQLQLAAKVESATTLAGSISDQYAGLLAGIRTRSVQLLERFPEYTAVRKPLEEIEQAALAGEKINRRLATLAAHNLPRPELFSLTGLLRRTRKMIESIAGQGVLLSVQTDPETRKLWADATQIEQVLLNLVIHASASLAKEPGDAQRTIGVQVGNTELRSGKTPRPFVRLAVTHSGREEGTGSFFDPAPLNEDRLALFVAHNIVTEHGGHLSAEPTKTGFCFEVLLPAHAAEVADAAPADGSMPTVLLIEPVDALRNELHNFFEGHGYSLLEAADANEGLALAQIHEGPLDIAIAGRSDAELLAHPFRELRPEMKLLEIAGGGESSSSNGGSSITRPFTEAELLEKVRTLLPQKPALAATAG